MSHLVDFIRTTSLFGTLDGLHLNAVSAFLGERHYTAGQLIFRQGDPGAQMFIVRSGMVSLLAKDKDGSDREVYEFGPGRFFGEMSIIEGEPRSATCEAVQDTELLVLEGVDFFRLVWEHPMIGVRMLSSMAGVMAGWLDEASGFLGDLVRWGETASKRAVTDSLSGLFNRRFLEEAVRGRFSRAGGVTAGCALLMLDIDHFHTINERFGTPAGDTVIAAAGSAFGKLLRDGDVAARLAGDEFAFFMPDAGIEEGLALAERIRAEAEKIILDLVPVTLPGVSGASSSTGKTEQVRLSVSIGVAASPLHAHDPESLTAVADKALFRAKEEGRNRVVCAGSG
ncbi:MAG: GGDEF domain-containing protein [Spirochaetia bacterium]|nr:GGDEF domain-containing protein [Spirochaetia bacterium]